MTEIDEKWAWRKIEAMADDSLAAADLERMRSAMNRDRALRRAVARARALRKALRSLAREPVPPALARRLIGNVEDERPRAGAAHGVLSWASAAGAAVLAAGLLLALMQPMRPAGPTDRQADALREFAIAMTYVRRSSAIVREQLGEAVEGGLREALDAALDRTGNADERQRESTE